MTRRTALRSSATGATSGDSSYDGLTIPRLRVDQTDTTKPGVTFKDPDTNLTVSELVVPEEAAARPTRSSSTLGRPNR